MKTKKRTEIIFERHEITRIRVARRSPQTPFDETADIQSEPPSVEKPVRLKTPLKEKLRGFWKRRRRLN